MPESSRSFFLAGVRIPRIPQSTLEVPLLPESWPGCFITPEFFGVKTIGWHFFAGADSQTEQKWLSLRLGCALIWALELFWLQKLAFPAVPWIRYPFLIQGF